MWCCKHVTNARFLITLTTPRNYKGRRWHKTCISFFVLLSQFYFPLTIQLHFSIETKRPPHYDGWQCSITFDGKDKSADQNADMCLFLEEWENNRESFQQYCMDKSSYEDWKDKTLAYYASQGVQIEEPEDLNTEERLKRKNALFSGK